MTKSICSGGKYELGGSNEDAIGLPLSFDYMPKEIQFEGQIFFLKKSFHVTLVAIGKIIEKHHIVIDNFLNKIVSDFCQFTNNYDFNPSEIVFNNKFKLVSKGEKRSIIAMCEVPNLKKFFDLLNEKYNLQLDYPPTHVTLYTLQPDKGIFVVDSDDIDQLTKDIEVSGIDLSWKKF